MSGKRRILFLRTILRIAAGLIVLLVLLCVGVFVTLQTDWFKEVVRQRIVSVVEQATGGRVELGRFDLDWRRLTVEVKQFVLHGSEPPSSQPLFRADSLRVELRILSIFERRIDLSSLIVKKPEVYLLFRPDGTTNIPSPKVRRQSNKTVIERLVDLKIKHLELNDGNVRTDFQRVPLTMRGENLAAVLTYDFSGPRYGVQLSSRQLHVTTINILPFAGDLDVQAQLEKDRLILQQVLFGLGKSKIHANGIVEHFVHPRVDGRVDAQVAAEEIGRFIQMPELRTGDVTVAGAAHYDASSSVTFRGKMTGRNLSYRSRSFALNRFHVQSDVFADLHKVALNHLVASALGSRIIGEGEIKDYRRLHLVGSIDRLNVREVGPFLTNKPLAWSGLASGPYRIDGTLSRRARDFVIHSSVQIIPGPDGIPISGDVDVTYKEARNLIEFGTSHLNFPNSHLMASGTLGQRLEGTLDSTNLDDLKPAMVLISSSNQPTQIPIALANGHAHFDGTVTGSLKDPLIQGNVELMRFQLQGDLWERLRSRVSVAKDGIDFTSLSVDQQAINGSGNGHIGFSDWVPSETSPVRLQGQFKNADVGKLLTTYSKFTSPMIRGIASGTVDVSGTIDNPVGNAKLTVDSLDAYGQLLNQIQAVAAFGGDLLQITQGRVQSGPALISFSGKYQHVPGTWLDGQAQMKIDSNGFPLASISEVRKYVPSLDANVEIHMQGAARVARDRIEPKNLDGSVAVRQVTVDNVAYGNISLVAATQGQVIDAKVSGDLRSTQLEGTAQIQLAAGYPTKGALRLARLNLATVYDLASPGQTVRAPFDGFLQGGLTWEGPLLDAKRMRASARIDQLQLNPSIPSTKRLLADSDDLVLKNLEPIVIEVQNGLATIRSLQVGAKDTSLTLKGSVPLQFDQAQTNQRQANQSIDLRADGSLNLKIFELADPNVQSAGTATIAASVVGTPRNPSVTGVLEIKRGSFSLTNVPNGLSNVNGTLKFDRTRATIQKLTANSGGGTLSLNGSVSFVGGGPLVYQLGATANAVRVRYKGGISVTASSDLKFAGTSEHSLLSGSVTVTKAAFNPSTDVGSLLASTTAPVASPSNEKDFLQAVELDVTVESAPNLQLSTSLSQDVEAEIAVHLRGTPNNPAVLGSVSVNQGDIKVFGTKYTINRGLVNFFNPAKIEPVLDLDLQTVARGITVDITVAGPLSKLNVNYRSDPPLQPRDIIALLAVGRAPSSVTNLAGGQITNDSSALQSGANTVLGQAISPVSNRLSRLFGITNIKIDPLVQGVTNTPQARLTVEQQVSRSITLIYITNLQQTSEQIFRLEWAIDRQYSLIALRDDNGEFGIDILYKKRFK